MQKLPGRMTTSRKFSEQLGQCLMLRTHEDSTIRDCRTVEAQPFQVGGWAAQLEGIRRPHEGRTGRHLFLRLREHRRRVLFPVFVRKEGLEVLRIVNPVDEYALQLLKEFDRKRLKSTINLLPWTSMLLQHQQFYTRHLLLWSSTSVTYATPVTRMTAPTTVVTLPVTTVMIVFFFSQRHLRTSSISPSQKKD